MGRAPMKMVAAGMLTPNEAREMEGLAPLAYPSEWLLDIFCPKKPRGNCPNCGANSWDGNRCRYCQPAPAPYVNRIEVPQPKVPILFMSCSALFLLVTLVGLAAYWLLR